MTDVSDSSMTLSGAGPLEEMMTQGTSGFFSEDMALDFVKTLLQQKNPKCVSFSLAHLSQEGDGIILTLPAERGEGKEEAFAAAIVHRFQNLARADIRTHQRQQRYAICGYAAKDQCLGRYPFMLSPPMSNQMSIESDPATPGGFVANVMRWGDIALQFAQGREQQIIEFYREELGRARGYITQLETRRLEMFRMVEELETKKLEREILMQREKNKDARVERLFVQFEFLVPLLAEKYGVPLPMKSGGKGGAEVETDDPIAGFIQLFASLSDEQKQTMMGCLDQPQLAKFSKALQGLMRMQMEAQQKRAAEAPTVEQKKVA